MGGGGGEGGGKHLSQSAYMHLTPWRRSEGDQEKKEEEKGLSSFRRGRV